MNSNLKSSSPTPLWAAALEYMRLEVRVTCISHNAYSLNVHVSFSEFPQPNLAYPSRQEAVLC